MSQDVLIDVLVEIEDVTRRLTTLRRAVADAIASEPWTRESFSKNAAGLPCVSEPDRETLTHEVAPPDDLTLAMIDEPPSRP